MRPKAKNGPIIIVDCEWEMDIMRKLELLSATALTLFLVSPALAQTAEEADLGVGDIVVTAQRQSESLQSVPIAVSAFSAETLEKQQIKNASDLQLTLPNVTFTKTNFTSSSFTIRGIGDLCVGVSCDQATAIHLNDSPLFATRLFETEYFDMERLEVLRGPQGTLFGRNATSGVVNFITAKPDLSGFHASAEAEYGNFNAYKVKGMLNLPISDTIAARVAGFYLKRDGYTKNLFDNSDIDGRDLYSVRGSLRWEPSDSTRIDLMGSYFHEDDDRARIQKQLCQRDPSGVLGCLPGRLDYGTTNANSSFVGVLSSQEFLRIRGIPAAFGLGSVYGPDAYATTVNPADVRTVNTDTKPTYFTSELTLQGKLEQDFGAFKLDLSGTYQKVKLDSRQDYNSSVQNRAVFQNGLNTLAAAAAGGIPGLPAAYFKPIADALIPNGPTGQLCTSLPEFTGTGSYGGHKVCAATPLDFDRSDQYNTAWSAEAIVSSNFDGPFNFLLGGIYAKSKLTENSYFVNSFGIDYVSGLLGTFTALGSALPPAYLGTPFFRNNTDSFTLDSYGVFGEAYFEINDTLKLTGGLRYNHDKKSVAARSTLASFLVPFAATNAFSSPYVGSFDADAGVAGNQLFQNRSVTFGEYTGRVVLDWQVGTNSLIYASYSRGYKSGGINPPLQPIFAVSESFAPEFVNSFEIGSKNTLAGGKLRLNLTAFYYQYKALQLSRIVARTSVNDNVDANIYGLEIEAIIRPTRALTINMNASYLHTKVAQDKLLGNPRDPSGGRADAVIIKDMTNGSNCAVTSNAGSAAAAQGFVTAVNTGLGLRAPTAFAADSGLAAGTTGAFGICSVLQANAGANFTVHTAGVPVNIKGNELPGAPNYKFSAGAQYTHEFASGMTLVPRIDLTYTGENYGNIFNGHINKVQGYSQVNAQVQLNGVEDKWFVRGFVQNLTNNSATTGLYITDQSSGLYTNIFTLEPRRYGIAAGIKF